jgi:hypothetical protein
MTKLEKYKNFGSDFDRLFSLLENRPLIPEKKISFISINSYSEERNHNPFVGLSFFESINYEFICLMIEDYPTLFSQKTISNINELETKHTGIREKDRYDRLPLHMIYFNNMREARKIYQSIKSNKEFKDQDRSKLISLIEFEILKTENESFLIINGKEKINLKKKIKVVRFLSLFKSNETLVTKNKIVKELGGKGSFDGIKTRVGKILSPHNLKIQKISIDSKTSYKIIK